MQDKFLTLEEMLSMLSISQATANNWIRLGKLEVFHINGCKMFKSKAVQKILDEISDGKSELLQKRRNKKKISGCSVYKNYTQFSTNSVKKVENILAAEKFSLTECEIRQIIAEFALHLIADHEKITVLSDNLTELYLSGDFCAGKFSPLIDDLLFNTFSTECGKQILHKFRSVRPRFIKTHDFLGFAYISLKNLGARKALGTYYTPSEIVERSVENISEHITKDKKILDPCCGTGNFLIHLDKYPISPENIFGSDIDLLSVQIARINMALNYNIDDISMLYRNITCKNSLTSSQNEKFDIIIGNPPWGYNFSNSEKNALSKLYSTALCRNPESYDIFVEYAIKSLKNDGILSFILPEAILNVNYHKAVRKIIISNCSFRKISYIGNVFSGVLCPAVILCLKKTGNPSVKGCKIENKNQKFTIKKDRKLDENVICLNVSDSQQCCIEKMEKLKNHFTLKNNADFALGIITGRNDNFISDVKTDSNEIILRGSDLKKYTFETPERFIKFEPEKFQQSAPSEIYRAEQKLLYRFICNSPVFCYDGKGTLSLNSCNIIIPKIPEIDIKYILAVLNSRASAFYFKTRFNSLKILRSHIEKFPIPKPKKAIHDEIVKKVDCILEKSGDIVKHYMEIDDMIMSLYKFSKRDVRTILSTIEPQETFL